MFIEPIPFSQIPQTTLKYLWYPYLPYGRISLLAADPGMGKTSLALHFAAQISQNRPIGPTPPTPLDPTPKSPDDPSSPHILLLSPEENPHDSLLPRLLAQNANLTRIHHLPLPTDKQKQKPLRDYLQCAANSLPRCDLIIIDPITALFSLTPSNAQIQPLIDFAHDSGIAILLTTRLAKALPTHSPNQKQRHKISPQSLLRRAIGSLAYAAAARSIFLLLPDPNPPQNENPTPNPHPNPTPTPTPTPTHLPNPNLNLNPNLDPSPTNPTPRTLFVPVKSHLPLLPPPLSFRLTETLTWDPHLLPQESLLPLPDPDLPPHDPLQQAAAAFLQAALANGPITATSLIAQAKTNLIAERTLQRAKVDLNITSLRNGYSNNWFWRLPDDPREPYISDIDKTVAALQNHGDLAEFLPVSASNAHGGLANPPPPRGGVAKNPPSPQGGVSRASTKTRSTPPAPFQPIPTPTTPPQPPKKVEDIPSQTVIPPADFPKKDPTMQKSSPLATSAIALTLALAASLPFLSPPTRAATPTPPAAPPTQEINLMTPTKIRADFLKLIARPAVPLDPKLDAPTQDNTFTKTRFTLNSPLSDHITSLILTSQSPAATAAGSRRPVVILLHGTGGKKEDELPLMRQLAAKNFLAVAIDAPYHGERAGPRISDGLKNSYERAVHDAWQNNDRQDVPHTHPFFYDTVWDVMRLVDFLQTRPDVDPARIGLYGVSKGGIETYLTAAVDPRIAAAVPCISVESFKWADDNNMWQHRIETIQSAFDAAWKEYKSANPTAPEKPDPAFLQLFYDRINPGLTSEFDGPSMIQLIAPRPLLTINGELDPRTPPASLQLCLTAAKSAYHAQNADDKLQSLIEPNTPHRVTPAAEQTAIDFFVKWLKP